MATDDNRDQASREREARVAAYWAARRKQERARKANEPRTAEQAAEQAAARRRRWQRLVSGQKPMTEAQVNAMTEADWIKFHDAIRPRSSR